MPDQVMKCPTCNELYVFQVVSSDARDQSACPKCVDEAYANMSNYIGSKPPEKVKSATAKAKETITSEDYRNKLSQ